MTGYDYKDIKINILGENYNVIKTAIQDKSWGRTDYSIRTITLEKGLWSEPTKNELQDVSVFANKVTRHEILHAMMFECGIGMDCNSSIHSEEVIDWIARMYPKMKKIFKKLDVEDA